MRYTVINNKMLVGLEANTLREFKDNLIIDIVIHYHDDTDALLTISCVDTEQTILVAKCTEQDLNNVRVMNHTYQDILKFVGKDRIDNISDNRYTILTLDNGIIKISKTCDNEDTRKALVKIINNKKYNVITKGLSDYLHYKLSTLYIEHKHNHNLIVEGDCNTDSKVLKYRLLGAAITELNSEEKAFHTLESFVLNSPVNRYYGIACMSDAYIIEYQDDIYLLSKLPLKIFAAKKYGLLSHIKMTYDGGKGTLNELNLIKLDLTSIKNIGCIGELYCNKLKIALVHSDSIRIESIATQPIKAKEVEIVRSDIVMHHPESLISVKLTGAEVAEWFIVKSDNIKIEESTLESIPEEINDNK